MEEGSFQELKEKAIDTQLCFLCGTCVAVCPAGCIAFKDNGPDLDGECTECGRCIEACPGIGAPLKELDQLIFGRVKTGEEEQNGLGIRLSDRNLVSGDREIFENGYSGGKVTSTLAYLLENKEIDAAIVSQWGEESPFPWLSWPVIAATRDELIRGTGSKYVFSPNLISLEEVARRDDIKNVAIVGLGCHLQGFRKLQYLGDEYLSLVKKVKYTLGLYCGSPMVSRDDFLEYVANLCEVSPHEITCVDFKRVSEEFDIAFNVILKDGSKAGKRINLLELFPIMGQYRRWNRCRFCTDYSAELADISFGGIHVTCRTPAGEDAVNRAVEEGWLVDAPPNQMLDNISAEMDLKVAKEKKIKTKERIADYRGKGKPVPVYD